MVVYVSYYHFSSPNCYFHKVRMLYFHNPPAILSQPHHKPLPSPYTFIGPVHYTLHPSTSHNLAQAPPTHSNKPRPLPIIAGALHSLRALHGRHGARDEHGRNSHAGRRTKQIGET